jgi:pyridinium-3,5-bisthiocarboxylic acid mononucleotide nickel chelatase
MKIAYLECPTGIAGDMCLGALVHAGVPLSYLTEQLSLLGIADEYKLWSELVQRNGQQATKVHVDLTSDHSDSQFTFAASPSPESAAAQNHSHEHPPDHHHGHPHDHPPDHPHDHPHSHNHPYSPDHSHPQNARHLPEIEHLIRSAHLPPRATDWSLQVFRRLAEAEGAVHGIPAEQVHFHEVGATDAIVDIIGTCLGLDWLGIEALHCSPLPTGGGTIRAAHGRLPVPAPAVLKLWEMRQIPVYSNGIQREMVTPTGAAIATTLATQFGAPPPMTLNRIGLGAGSIDLELPNILRLWIGETDNTINIDVHRQTTIPQESITLLETQLDDINPQAIGYVFESLLAAGALDVFTQAIGMKKSRPGTLLTVVCRPEQVVTCEAIIYQETTTLGIRRIPQQRTVLDRQIETVETPGGKIRIKVARQGEQILNVQPEYEDCAQIARQTQLPWQEVHRLALQTWHSTHTA